MSPRLWVIFLLVVAVLMGAGWYLFFGGRPVTTRVIIPATNSPSPGPAFAPAKTHPAVSNSVAAPQARGSESAANSQPLQQPAKAQAPRPYILGTPDNPPSMEPAAVLDNMRIVLRNYGSMFGGNPVGNNAEITAALNGDNPKQVRFINPESGLRINGNGELVDWWGTPFFFHQLSASETEIHSAGPDRIMWTADDLVQR
jgi:hypothetical protein